MAECPYCSQSLADGFNFCPACCHQVTCRNPECRGQLVANAPICVKCGTVVATPPANTNGQNRFVRNIKQTRTSYEEHTEISATDTALGTLAPFVVTQLGGAPYPPHPRFPVASKRVVPPGQLSLAVGDAPDEELPVEIESKPTDVVQEVTEWSRVFERAESGELTLIEPDLKGKSKKEQQVRFILLLVGAHEDLGGNLVTKEGVLAAATRSRINDKNFSGYLRHLGEWVIYADAKLKLNPTGRRRAGEILNEVRDQQLPGGFQYWNPSAKSSRGATSRLSKEEQAVVEEWITKDVDLGKIQIAALGPTDLATVALWLLTHRLNVTRAVKPGLAYEYLSRKFSTIRADRHGFTDALGKSSRNRGRFGRNDKGEYFPTPDGVAAAEALRDGRSTAASGTSSE